MPRYIIKCPNCKNSIYETSSNIFPKKYRKYDYYSMSWDNSDYEDCKCEIGTKIKNDESKLLTLESELQFGKHRGKSVKWIIENDITYISIFIIEDTEYYLDNDANEYLEKMYSEKEKNGIWEN